MLMLRERWCIHEFDEGSETWAPAGDDGQDVVDTDDVIAIYISRAEVPVTDIKDDR